MLLKEYLELIKKMKELEDQYPSDFRRICKTMSNWRVCYFKVLQPMLGVDYWKKFMSAIYYIEEHGDKDNVWPDDILGLVVYLRRDKFALSIHEPLYETILRPGKKEDSDFGKVFEEVRYRLRRGLREKHPFVEAVYLG